MRYERDDYVHEHYSDDSINLKCVLSWKVIGNARSQSPRLQINFHNGWFYDSDHWKRPDRVEAVRTELQRIAGTRNDQPERSCAF
jgi:hypothetical protein